MVLKFIVIAWRVVMVKLLWPNVLRKDGLTVTAAILVIDV